MRRCSRQPQPLLHLEPAFTAAALAGGGRRLVVGQGQFGDLLQPGPPPHLQQCPPPWPPGGDGPVSFRPGKRAVACLCLHPVSLA